MKQRIIYTVTFAVLILYTNIALGQTEVSGTWAGGALTGSYKLTGNTTVTGTVSVSSGTLTIDLNGYTLDRKGTKATDFIFTVGESRTLNIVDNSNTKTGKIKGGKGDRGGCALISGILNFRGGEVIDCISTDGNYGDTPTTNTDAANQHYVTQGCGGAFFVNSGATLNMSGTAKITNCKTEKRDGTHGRGGAVWVAGTFNMSGGTISGCEASWGGAVFVFHGARNAYYNNDTRSGTFNMTGGTITNCRSYSDGCGVYTQSMVTISGDAKITSNRPLRWNALQLIDGKYPNVQLSGGHGGAIYATGDMANVTMSGGELSNNLAESGGAVMLWTSSTMTMTGGKMDSNYAMGKPSLGNGGALYLQGSTFNFNGGTLSNNVANRYGGAINTNQSATLNISGNCVISGNRASHGGGISQEAGECSLTLEGNGIQITGNEAHGHQVSVSDAGVNSVGNSLGNGGGIFIERGTVTMNGAKIKTNKASGHGGGASLYVNRIHGRRTSVVIEGGEISDNEAQYGGGIDVYANFQSLEDKYDEKDPFTGMSELTVNFKAGTLSGNKASANGAGIYVSFNETYSTATMTIGTASSTPVITNNIAVGNGGGFGMTNNGVITVNNINASGNKGANGGAIWLGTGQFTINNGILSNNTATENGGGIYVGSGTFKVNQSATLKGNEAAVNGGGIYLGGGTFNANNLTLGGDTELDGNSTGINGGGVYCAGEFTITGISVMKNNSATQNGGAVYVNGKNITLSGNTIVGNSAANGGALYVNGGSITMNGASTMSDNNASVSGGAAYVNKGTITTAPEKQSVFEGNTAENGDGGAFYIAGEGATKGNLLLKGETVINENKATKGSGGAFYVVTGDVTINKNATMTSNEAGSNGGAIYVQGGSINLLGATSISNNTACSNGGAAFVDKGSITTATGDKTTELSGNKATEGEGGAFYIAGDNSTRGTLNLMGITSFDGNEAIKSNGGAASLHYGDIVITGSNTTLTKNKAVNGGAFYVINGDITTTSGTISGNEASADGGVFYVNQGNIYLGTNSTNTVHDEISLLNNKALNGGAIALYNGVFSLSKNCLISKNTSSNFGGGLYIKNTSNTGKVMSFTGGTFTENTAKTGGAVCADGDITLTLASTMENNKATDGVGGGLYITNGVKMTFGDGLIRANQAIGAPVPDSETGTAKEKDAKSDNNPNGVTGVGGGIFIGTNSTLAFSSQEMGIYNNFATNAGADLCANGSGTTITLPNISAMNLKGFRVPGNALYWVEDYYTRESYTGYDGNGKTGIRYETALLTPSVEIAPYIINFTSDAPREFNNRYLCIDLGYDLVFVTITVNGLEKNDDAAIIMSYPQNTETKVGDNSTYSTELIQYRKVLFSGNQTRIVGIPSGDWKFDITGWSYKYNNNPTFTPGHTVSNTVNTSDDTKYINIKRDGINGKTDKVTTITVEFTKNENSKVNQVQEYQYRLVNRMTL